MCMCVGVGGGKGGVGRIQGKGAGATTEKVERRRPTLVYDRMSTPLSMLAASAVTMASMASTTARGRARMT